MPDLTFGIIYIDWNAKISGILSWGYIKEKKKKRNADAVAI